MKFNTKINKKEKSIVEINVNMDFSEIEKNKKKALDTMSKDAKIDGFRKGKVPADVLERQLGEESVLQEAANITINEVFPEILQKEKLQMIGYPAISVTKLAAGNDFEFKIEITVYPTVKLPEYKKIATSIKQDIVKVTKEDLKKVEENILNVYNKQEEQKLEEDKRKDFKPATKLTDDIIKTFGPFKNLTEFHEHLQKDLEQEKKNQAIEKQRGEISEKILEKVEMEVPEMLINVELDKMIAYLKDEAVKYGLEWENYLKSMKKTEEELKSEQREEATKRAKLEIILKEIYKKEKLKVDAKILEQQVAQISKMHPDAELNNIKLYVENILINESVMKFLESQSQKK